MSSLLNKMKVKAHNPKSQTIKPKIVSSTNMLNERHHRSFPTRDLLRDNSTAAKSFANRSTLWKRHVPEQPEGFNRRRNLFRNYFECTCTIEEAPMLVMYCMWQRRLQ